VDPSVDHAADPSAIAVAAVATVVVSVPVVKL
jgi:hypothetical protein